VLLVLIDNSVFNFTLTSLTEFTVLLHFCTELSNNDLVKVETCTKVISKNYYFSLIVLSFVLIFCNKSTIRNIDYIKFDYSSFLENLIMPSQLQSLGVMICK
jgi:hypothetical protein